MSKENVFSSADNANSITVSQVVNGVSTVMDFSSITRMVVTFDRVSIVADTDVDSNLIDWSEGSGKIIFRFNDLGVPETTCKATLKVYDSQHPDGQVLFHMDLGDLVFRFIDS